MRTESNFNVSDVLMVAENIGLEICEHDAQVFLLNFEEEIDSAAFDGGFAAIHEFLPEFVAEEPPIPISETVN